MKALAVIVVVALHGLPANASGDKVPRAPHATPRTAPPRAAPPKSAPAKKPARAAANQRPALSDGEIRKILIRESIEAYAGNCPCPYNTARNGSTCGGRSAWSRPGGEQPLCYPKDVSDEMVQEYRDRLRQEEASN